MFILKETFHKFLMPKEEKLKIFAFLDFLIILILIAIIFNDFKTIRICSLQV